MGRQESDPTDPREEGERERERASFFFVPSVRRRRPPPPYCSSQLSTTTTTPYVRRTNTYVRPPPPLLRSSTAGRTQLDRLRRGRVSGMDGEGRRGAPTTREKEEKERTTNEKKERRRGILSYFGAAPFFFLSLPSIEAALPAAAAAAAATAANRLLPPLPRPTPLPIAARERKSQKAQREGKRKEVLTKKHDVRSRPKPRIGRGDLTNGTKMYFLFLAFILVSLAVLSNGGRFLSNAKETDSTALVWSVGTHEKEEFLGREGGGDHCNREKTGGGVCVRPTLKGRRSGWPGPKTEEKVHSLPIATPAFPASESSHG